MTIRFRCRSCRKLLSIGTHKAGQEVHCPICSLPQQVPCPGMGAERRSAQARSPRSCAPAPLCSRAADTGGMWNLAFALAVAASGFSILLIAVWAIAAPTRLRSLRSISEKPPASWDGSAGSQERTSAQRAPLPTPVKAQERASAERAPAPLRSRALSTEALAPRKKPAAPVAFAMKRRQNKSEEELRKELMLVAEVALPRSGPVRQGDLGQSAFALAGLPWQRGAECWLGKEPADNLQLFSQKIRQCIQQNTDGADALARKLLAHDEICKRPEAIPALVQMLQAENQPVRLTLIQGLAGINGRQATRALADRALYDLSPKVRQAAVKALKDGPVEEYRDLLLDGLRYPWSPVADHAAEALAALKVQSAVPELLTMLEKPARARVRGQTPVVIRELVKINHQRNCMLCHPASFSPGDPVRGAVPLPGSSASYSQGQFFVRADVTYLRQDFSVMQPEGPGAGPAFQRYDYVIRSRRAVAKDLAQELRQRGAILFALKELMGKEGGPVDLHQALLHDEESRLHKAEIAFWKAKAEQLAKEKSAVPQQREIDNQEAARPIKVTSEKPRFNVDSMHWPVVFKEDRKLGSQFRALGEFLERLDNSSGSGDMIWAIKEALQALGNLRARLDSYPITDLHANEAKNFLDGIETNLWAMKRFV